MRYSRLLLPALAALASARDITSDAPAAVVETPDVLPSDDLKEVATTQPNVTPGLEEQIVEYNPEASVTMASVEASKTPLSTFPASTGDAINAAGESPPQETAPTVDSVRRRVVVPAPIQPRAACAPEATTSNFYNVDVSSPSAFKADPKIASAVNAAPIPAGYFQNFKGINAASSTNAYLGYSLIKTGYDVTECARRCTIKAGCLAFNIFFERAPVVAPGKGCESPAAFAAIKCSFWGVPLDSSTATNKGQTRSKFVVAVAGSSTYTTYSIGGPVDGYIGPARLDTAAMNAPLRDCAGTWAYMGYKLYTDQPFDPRLCSAACDAQTEYNLAHPPSKGKKPAKCAAFGTYLVQKQTSAGSAITGQMCTMYTSDFDAKYAVNKGSTDPDGTKWTFLNSFWYSKTQRQPICSSIISYLKAEGQDFCSSFISYDAPQTSALTTITPTGKLIATATATVTTANPDGDAATMTGDARWKRALRFVRQDENPESIPEATTDAFVETTTEATVEPTTATTPSADLETSESIGSIDATVQTVENLGPSTIAVLTEYQVAALPTNGSQPLERRAAPTPTSIAGWEAARISEACSAVATGLVTVINTATAASQTSTTTVTTAVGGMATCVVPSQQAEYKNRDVIWGSWNTQEARPDHNPNGISGQEAVVQLPFEHCVFGICTNVITVGSDGYYHFTNPNKLDERITVNVYRGTNQYLYPGWYNGVFSRVVGPMGRRQFTLSWYASTWNWGHAGMHVTASWYENMPGTVYYKYYDAVQVEANDHSIAKGTSYSTRVWPPGRFMVPGTQIKIETTSSGTASFQASQRNRVDCCRDNAGWHSCTEWQPQDL